MYASKSGSSLSNFKESVFTEPGDDENMPAIDMILEQAVDVDKSKFSFFGHSVMSSEREEPIRLDVVAHESDHRIWVGEHLETWLEQAISVKTMGEFIIIFLPENKHIMCMEASCEEVEDER